MEFAKEICNISDAEIFIIIQARRALLFNDSEPWI